MLYRFLADVVLVLHLGFVLFVVAGAFLILRWPRIAWVQLVLNVIGYALVFARTAASRRS